ncbi:alpha/beta fold hydrolase [Variovorax sp. CF313]|uniref:alpha/beta fold hydrolase n=1 Tax=Variovorax sp. CF313 TaxID=1144315 RepID=UPI000679B025|nr:alpha/beta hydrolase [Variovorax sp. CF313]
MLLLPGLMNDQRVWETIRHALSADRFVAVAETHTANNVAALAVSALSLMPSGPFAVAGFSLGGYVAMEVCRQAQQRIAGVALLDTGARADSEEMKESRRRMVTALGSATASFTQVANGFAARIIHPSHSQDAKLLELLGDMARNVGSEGFARQQTAAINRPDSRQILGELRCPALVVCGREDQVTPPSLSEEMSSLLSGDVELVIISECGHMSTLEQPAAVLEAFNRWAARVDAARF